MKFLKKIKLEFINILIKLLDKINNIIKNNINLDYSDDKYSISGYIDRKNILNNINMKLIILKLKLMIYKDNTSKEDYYISITFTGLNQHEQEITITKGYIQKIDKYSSLGNEIYDNLIKYGEYYKINGIKSVHIMIVKKSHKIQ